MTPYWTNGVATLHQADARGLPVADGSVHCVITSPPYWGLRDYGLSDWEGGDPKCSHVRQTKSVLQSSGLTQGQRHRAGRDVELPGAIGNARAGWPGGICGHCGARQLAAGIGLEPTLSEWLANIVAVGREVWRVLRDDGTWWLNLGDAYAGSGKGPAGGDKQASNPAATMPPVVSAKIHDKTAKKWGPNAPAVDGLPAKSLMMQPARAALALQDDGWILRSEIVWHKPNPMPESVSDRPTSAHEKVYLLVKSRSPQFWTHRDGIGKRNEPEPDYRYVDRADDTEHLGAPAAWSDEWIECPKCGGKGEIPIYKTQLTLFDDNEPVAWVYCETCNHSRAEHPGWIKRWRRINLWTAHDYFYDAEAVRQPSEGWHGNKFAARSPERHAGENRTVPKDQQPPGANLRNVWQIPTQGRPEAHFATFPDELPRRCILAGTSAHGVCADCGAPWVRKVERIGGPPKGNHRSRGDFTESGKSAHKTGTVAGSDLSAIYAKYGMPSNQTIGWQPTCDCNAGRVPAAVLDPFVGSGTTIAVAQQLGRRGIGTDLNPEYLGIARKNLGKLTSPKEVKA